MHDSFAVRRIERVVLPADVEQRADVRMIQLRDDARFPLEPLATIRIGCEVGAEDFNRDRPIEPDVAGFVDFAHAAHAEWGNDFVWAKATTWRKSHGWLTRLSRQT